MKEYHDALEMVLEHGEEVHDRTGTGTLSHFGHQMRFFLQDGFPAITTKKLAWKAVVGEILWFLEGSTDERRLAELTYARDRKDLIGRGTIWTANADAQGKELGYRNDDFYKGLGPVYGAQWRDFGGNGTDQINWLINEIRTNPDSRRLILSAWNPTQLETMSLPPCHVSCQFRVYNGRLSCQMYQRSADLFLGVPFNIASYSLLTHIIARECNLEIGEFIHTIGDAHIYSNHISQVHEQLSRSHFKQPELVIDESFDLMEGLNDKFPLNSASKFTLENYEHHPAIKAPMAV
jgi:thymidylate synthase